MNENFVYRYGDNLYINLTNKCCNACDFCIRNNGDGIGDSGNLWLSREPSASEVCALIDTFGDYNEIVFCGYGEPIYKLEEIKEISEYLHKHGKRVRLNTNGQGDLIHGESVAKKLAGYIDIVSISLNAASAKAYQEVCHSEFGEKAFYSLLNFAKEAKEYVPSVKLSLVDVVGEEEIKKAKELCDSLGIDLRVRAYIS